MYQATVIADSMNTHGVRLTTLSLRYWRAIHAEVMTHRAFSRNAGSSRATPVKTMLKQVWSDPAGPLHWGVNQPGMQARAELVGWRRAIAAGVWRLAAKATCGFAWALMKLNVHKQVANRLLEPFQYINVLVTATDWDNFFELRDHPDAQPEIQHLAEQMRAAMRVSFPAILQPGEWHLPYVTNDDRKQYDSEVLIKLSTARNARVSYMTFEGRKPNPKRDIGLHDRLVVSRPIHASPAEHVARAMDNDMYVRNFRGFVQYRVYLEQELEAAAAQE